MFDDMGSIRGPDIPDPMEEQRAERELEEDRQARSRPANIGPMRSRRDRSNSEEEGLSQREVDQLAFWWVHENGWD